MPLAPRTAPTPFAAIYQDEILWDGRARSAFAAAKSAMIYAGAAMGKILHGDLVQRSHIGRRDIHCVVAAGNTSMLHFLLGLEADLIRLSPFVPSTTTPPPLPTSAMV